MLVPVDAVLFALVFLKQSPEPDAFMIAMLADSELSLKYILTYVPFRVLFCARAQYF